MSHRRIAAEQTASITETGQFAVVPDPFATVDEEIGRALLTLLYRRWRRVLAACDGDVEQARRVWDDVGRREAAA